MSNSMIKMKSFLKWEWMLVMMLVLINIMNASLVKRNFSYGLSTTIMLQPMGEAPPEGIKGDEPQDPWHSRMALIRIANHWRENHVDKGHCFL